MNLKGSILRFLSQFDHYGTCHRCKISWKYRDHMQPINYAGSARSFPLCQQCFDAVSPEQAAYHFEENWEPYQDFTEDKWVEAKKTFYLGAIAMKHPSFFSDGDGDEGGRIGRVVGWDSDGGRVEVAIDQPAGERRVWMSYGDVRIEEDGSGESYAVPVGKGGGPE